MSWHIVTGSSPIWCELCPLLALLRLANLYFSKQHVHTVVQATAPSGKTTFLLSQVLVELVNQLSRGRFHSQDQTPEQE